jgi:exopolyphosphatase/guanosine-5'-triphosphate,3'-diphosphate pyrophosphatase
VLDGETLSRSLKLLCSARAVDVARRFALDLERVRLLPAGLLILQAASESFGAVLQVGRGGLREGILLEAAGG